MPAGHQIEQKARHAGIVAQPFAAVAMRRPHFLDLHNAVPDTGPLTVHYALPVPPAARVIASPR